MTIRSHIDARALNEQYGKFLDCAENAPEGTYEAAKEVERFMSETADTILEGARRLGLTPCNADGIRELEAVIYGYLKAGDVALFSQAEGFGSAFSADRAGAASKARADRDFLASLGVRA